MMSPKELLGIYIHIPFCRSKCLYCDFCSFAGKDGESVENYLASLCAEIISYSRAARGRKIDTLYIGGGTPTLLTSSQLADILRCVRENYELLPDAEVTVECNPTSELGADYFGALRVAGINRLSIGMQSAVESELKLLGRRHSLFDIERTVFAARKGGFDNISLDLMFGIPNQTPESLERSLDCAISLSPEHISVYGLQLEEGTPLCRLQDRYSFPDEESERSMYFSAIERLSHAGYSQYEISNFAKAGRESLHNLRYWHCEEYLGFGLAAHSYFDSERYFNTSDMQSYLCGEAVAGRELISPEGKKEEYVLLALRLTEGIPPSEILEICSPYNREKLETELKSLCDGGFASCENGRFFLTPEGMYVSNFIISQILSLI